MASNDESEVSVSIDGGMAAAIDFSGGMLGVAKAVRWSSYELFTGRGAGVVLARSLTLEFRNYLQVSSVRAGINRVSLGLIHVGRSGPVERAELEGGSKIVITEFGPAHLGVKIGSKLIRTRVGGTVPISYQVQSSGMPARGVGVLVGVPVPNVVVLGSTTHYLGWVVKRDEEVVVQPLRSGLFRVRIWAVGDTGEVVVGDTWLNVSD